MRCDDVRRVAPSSDAAEQAAVRAHANGCLECEQLLEAYEADLEVLSALRDEPRALPPVMDGFADAVMKAVAEEPRLAAAPEPAGEILRPSFGGLSGLVALAAMTLLAIGIGIVLSGAPQEGPPTARTPDPRPAPQVTPVANAEPLPAPRRATEAPMPLRRRAGIGVPVDGGRAAELPSGPLFDVLRDVQRAFPDGLNQRPPRRVPPLRPGEREVRF